MKIGNILLIILSIYAISIGVESGLMFYLGMFSVGHAITRQIIDWLNDDFAP